MSVSCAKYIPAVREVRKRASRGEKVLGQLFPSRGSGFPGGWSQDRLEAVFHMKNWVAIAVDAICSLVAQLVPNIAYVSNGADNEGKPRHKSQWLDHDRNGFGQGNGYLELSPNIDRPYSREIDQVKPGSPYIKALNGRHNGWDLNVTDVPKLPYVSANPNIFQFGGYQRKALSQVKPHEEVEPVEYDHPARRLIENPNPWDTWFDFSYERQMFLELCGVNYTWAVPNDYGIPCELWCIPAHWVWPRTGGARYVPPDNPHADELVQYYEIRPWGGMGSAGIIKIPPNEIIMEYWKSPINKIDGYSKLSAQAMAIDLEESSEKANWSQVQNQALPSCFVELPPDFEDPDDARARRLQARFMDHIQGEYNAGKPFVGLAGMKLTPLSFSPDAMMYHQCLDEETECLTAEGWRRYTELDKDSLVACYDPSTDSVYYDKPSSVYVSHYSGMMSKWKGDNLDILATPDHRMYVQITNVPEKGPWGIKRIHQLRPTGTYNIRIASPVVGDRPGKVKIVKYPKGSRRDVSSDGTYDVDPVLWARFIGWYVSEGHLDKGRNQINISQHIDSIHTPAIENLLQAVLPMEWHRCVCGGQNNNSCYQWRASDRGVYDHLDDHCGRGAKSKRLPRYMMSWPADVLVHLLDAAVRGDGKGPTIDKYGHKHWIYRTTSRQLVEDIMEIGVKCGLRATLRCNGSYTVNGETSGYYVVHLCDRDTRNVKGSNRSLVDYDGTIWCVTVSTGLFVVRRNGCVHITGNTKEDCRDQVLSAFRVPGAAVGLVKEMTYGCLDDQTECLTTRGWKKYHELTDDTRIACYDPDQDAIVYRKPSGINIKPYKGKMHHWHGQRIDAMLTPNHRVYMQRFRTRKHKATPFEIMRADEIPGVNFRILGAAKAACDTPEPVTVQEYGGRYNWQEIDPLSIDPKLWLEFLGYYISEGHAAKPKNGYNCWEIDITQRADSPLTPKIQKCLNALPYARDWRRYKYDGNVCYHWRCAVRGLHEHLVRHCGQGSCNKKIPNYVKTWPAEYLRVLLDALIAGDGRKPRITQAGVWHTTYRTISKQLADDVQEIAIKCGLSASISISSYNGKDDFTVNLMDKRDMYVMPYQRTEVDYEGDVWCVTVPTGLFVVRRNGKVHITGNSVLSTLAQFCQGCIDPRLMMLGQKWTKELMSKFPQDRHSRRERRIRLWYDSCEPHDPQQINSDISTDLQACAISPNEIRALRGRKPWPYGGDNPMSQGPGGLAPLPWNKKEELDKDTADLLGFYQQHASGQAAQAEAQQQQQQQQQQGGMGGDMGGMPPLQPGQSIEEMAEPGTEGTPPDMGAGIEEPNGPPTKSHKRNGVHKNQRQVVNNASVRGVTATCPKCGKSLSLVPWTAIYERRTCRNPECGAKWNVTLMPGPDKTNVIVELTPQKSVAKQSGSHSYASTQVNLPGDLATAAQRWVSGHIPDEIILESENEPHVTARYGIR